MTIQAKTATKQGFEATKQGFETTKDDFIDAINEILPGLSKFGVYQVLWVARYIERYGD